MSAIECSQQVIQKYTQNTISAGHKQGQETFSSTNVFLQCYVASDKDYLYKLKLKETSYENFTKINRMLNYTTVKDLISDVKLYESQVVTAEYVRILNYVSAEHNNLANNVYRVILDRRKMYNNSINMEMVIKVLQKDPCKFVMFYSSIEYGIIDIHVPLEFPRQIITDLLDLYAKVCGIPDSEIISWDTPELTVTCPNLGYYIYFLGCVEIVSINSPKEAEKIFGIECAKNVMVDRTGQSGDELFIAYYLTYFGRVTTLGKDSMLPDELVARLMHENMAETFPTLAKGGIDPLISPHSQVAMGNIAKLPK